MLRIWTATLLTWSCAMELQTIDMFRAMQMPEGGNETNRVQNNNMADVLGTLKYIMTEVIVEHVQGDPTRTARKYNIDSVGHYRVQVRNPAAIQEGGVMGFSNYFSAFDYGVATSQPALEELAKVGDFVGIQVTDPTVNAVVVLSYPYYWYSLTGVCPNLPWTCLRGSNYPSCPTTSEDVGVNPLPCKGVGCEGKSAPLADSCKADFSKEETLTKCCLQYGASFPKKVGKTLVRGTPMKGGLCKPGVVPTGVPTCVYNYKDLVEEDFVNLDELAGITAMKCGNGDRTCKDWADWRKNCYDPDKKYKKKFTCSDCDEQGNWQWSWEETDFCVEYDLNPLCQDSPAHCADPQCQALKPEDKEVGLPFWQGRCEETENIRRAEKLAAKALGQDQIENHEIVAKDLLDHNPKCSTAPNCKPNPNGGPYCSRQFGGVCTPCYIPGTQEPFLSPDNTPTCPFSLKEEMGAAGVAANTKCKSKSASDLCCLYGVDGSCDKDFADGSKVTTDMEGYLGVMATAHKDPIQMFNFATKWIEENGGEVQDQDKLKDQVYWMWRIHPPKAPLQAWETFQANLKDSSFAKFTTTTTTTTTTEAEGTTTTEKDPKDVVESSNAWKFALAACAALIVVAVFFWMYRDNQRRQTPDRRSRMEEGDGRSLQMSRM